MPHARRPILFNLFLLAAAAGSVACDNSNPAGPSATAAGATITGSLVGDRAMSGVTVAVSGTNLGASVGPTQRFTIREVPSGTVRLLFKGPGLNGGLDLNGVQPADTIELIVRVHGSTVALDSEQRRRDDDNGGGGGATCPIAGANVNGNLDLVGDCTITGRVNGNVKISNGTLTLDGGVNGNVEQSGIGGVTVRLGGFVNGNVIEKGAGGVTVGGTVNGKVEEADEGDVVISVAGTVSEVVEKGFGDVEVNGTVTGNVEENEVGSVLGTGTVNGNVKESGPGLIAPGLTVKGNREEKG